MSDPRFVQDQQLGTSFDHGRYQPLVAKDCCPISIHVAACYIADSASYQVHMLWGDNPGRDVLQCTSALLLLATVSVGCCEMPVPSAQASIVALCLLITELPSMCLLCAGPAMLTCARCSRACITDMHALLTCLLWQGSLCTRSQTPPRGERPLTEKQQQRSGQQQLRQPIQTSPGQCTKGNPGLTRRSLLLSSMTSRRLTLNR